MPLDVSGLPITTKGQRHQRLKGVRLVKAVKKWASKERQLRRTIKDYQQELCDTHEELNRVRDASHELMVENNELEEIINDLQKKLEIEDENNANMRTTIASLQAQLKSKQTAIEVLTREVQNLRKGGLG